MHTDVPLVGSACPREVSPCAPDVACTSEFWKKGITCCSKQLTYLQSQAWPPGVQHTGLWPRWLATAGRHPPTYAPPLCSAGRRLTGTEFEKVSGKEKAKKWKASVRVLHEDGATGETIGDWLQVRPSVRVLRSAVAGPGIMGHCPELARV